jgi:hypothetical protein
VCDTAKVTVTFSVVCWPKLLSVSSRLVCVKDRTEKRELVLFFACVVFTLCYLLLTLLVVTLYLILLLDLMLVHV